VAQRQAHHRPENEHYSTDYGLANHHYGGNSQALADSVDRFFQAVAADLSLLNDNITPPPPEIVPYEFTISQADVECKLSQINVHKASGPDGLPDWLLRDFSNRLA